MYQHFEHAECPPGIVIASEAELEGKCGWQLPFIRIASSPSSAGSASKHNVMTLINILHLQLLSLRVPAWYNVGYNRVKGGHWS